MMSKNSVSGRSSQSLFLDIYESLAKYFCRNHPSEGTGICDGDLLNFCFVAFSPISFTFFFLFLSLYTKHSKHNPGSFARKFLNFFKKVYHSFSLCCGSALVSLRIWIHAAFFLNAIQIQGAKPMRIHPNPDPDPGQSWPSQKVI